MSEIRVDVERVAAVLIGNVWHTVKPGTYTTDDVEPIWFEFFDADGVRVVGPFKSVQAIREDGWI
jgi:hypothetical protein